MTVRPFRLVLAAVLLVLPGVQALPSTAPPSPCATAGHPADACVPFRPLVDTDWDVVPYGGHVFGSAGELRAFWDAHAPYDDPPHLDFEREFAVAIVGWDTLAGDASVVEVLTDAPGSYVVAYHADYLWGDIEFVNAPVEVAAVARASGAPAAVRFVGWQAAADATIDQLSPS